ncbi:MAG: hypothetical protein MZW92_25025 [Comamonadaceae bacterium]|nr:hypothetical protein [Comamonadaceae bacterium]
MITAEQVPAALAAPAGRGRRGEGAAEGSRGEQAQEADRRGDEAAGAARHHARPARLSAARDAARRAEEERRDHLGHLMRRPAGSVRCARSRPVRRAARTVRHVSPRPTRAGRLRAAADPGRALDATSSGSAAAAFRRWRCAAG